MENIRVKLIKGTKNLLIFRMNFESWQNEHKRGEIVSGTPFNFTKAAC